QAITVCNGNDITIIAIGGLLYNAVNAAKELSKEGINTRVISIGSLKPLDKKTILSAAAETKAMITLEEHSIIGGLGSAVAEVLIENNFNIPFKRLGVPSEFPERVGDQEWFLQKYGLDMKGIILSIKELIDKLMT
ncbi:transketolase family protein, partial [Alphaproteobacteria bacterium]|nr:transketolase family protein [Alphaproteobacteria bacterium]